MIATEFNNLRNNAFAGLFDGIDKDYCKRLIADEIYEATAELTLNYLSNSKPTDPIIKYYEACREEGELDTFHEDFEAEFFKYLNIYQ